MGDKEEEMLEVCASVLDAQQKALKVSANSMYGSLGTKVGLLSFIPGAASVTAMGRSLIITAIDFAINKYMKLSTVSTENVKPRLVYGDSVTGDTPIIVKDINNLVHIVPIDKLHELSNNTWSDYPGLKLDGEVRTEKSKIDISNNLRVWADGKWTPLKKIIRHKVDKKIYRVQTGNGCVDVTEDHSLVTPDRKKIKPKDVNVGSNLLTSFPTEFPRDTEMMEITEDEAWVWGFFMANGSCGEYENNWTLNSNNLDYLNKAKEILERFEPFEFKILDTYRLIPLGNVEIIVNKWRKLMYLDKSKIIPSCVLNGSLEVRKSFFAGRFCDDHRSYESNGMLSSQHLYYLAKSIG